MRFKYKPHPEDGDIRYKVFFSWFPIRIGMETRWLERVSVKQEYFEGFRMINWNARYVKKWVNIAFEQQPLTDYKHTPPSP